MEPVLKGVRRNNNGIRKGRSGHTESSKLETVGRCQPVLLKAQAKDGKSQRAKARLLSPSGTPRTHPLGGGR